MAMARFVAAYSRSDGSTPLWGDADNGRVLPLGTQALHDHRYLVSLVVRAWGSQGLHEAVATPTDERDWWFGPEPQGQASPEVVNQSEAFTDAGVYIMRTADDHIFIDCGPVGLGGRGGHGHNDCLSIEIVLLGSRLFVDSGTYVYSSSVEWRNRFRSTGFHNTPVVDGVEQNRLVRPEFLWLLENDAQPSVSLWQPGAEQDIFRGSHNGYERLRLPVQPVRTVTLDRLGHAVLIKDEFIGEGPHEITCPYHLAPEVEVAEIDERSAVLLVRGQQFLMAWDSDAGWKVTSEMSWVSESYGVRVPASMIVFRRNGPLAPLEVRVSAGSVAL